LSIYPEIQNLLLQCRCEAVFAEAILPVPRGAILQVGLSGFSIHPQVRKVA
jgi:hypothetical protein